MKVAEGPAGTGAGLADAGVAAAALEGAVRALLREMELREEDSGMEEGEEEEEEDDEDEDEEDEEDGEGRGDGEEVRKAARTAMH